LIPEDIVPLFTERLILRLVEASDAAAIHRFRSDPTTTRYLSHDPLTPAANSERLAELLALRGASSGEWFNYGWAITLRGCGEIIGDARTWNSTALTAGMLSPGKHPARHAALAYVLHPDYHRQGYGREAAGALVRWLFAERRISTVVAGVYEPNIPSIRLLRSLGFRQDGITPADQDTAGKGYPLLMFHLDSSQGSTA
jgi:RimJ/RimL family protein N-acetyltransferase